MARRVDEVRLKERERWLRLLVKIYIKMQLGRCKYRQVGGQMDGQIKETKIDKWIKLITGYSTISIGREDTKMLPITFRHYTIFKRIKIMNIGAVNMINTA